MINKSNLNEKMIQDVATNSYVLILKSLDDVNKKILRILSRTDEAPIKRITQELDIKMASSTLYPRLNALIESRIVAVRKKGGKETAYRYYIPDFLKPLCADL